MVFKATSFTLDPEAFAHELVRVKSSEPVRIDLTEFVEEEVLERLGGLLMRFLDLEISVNDLTHQRWDLRFLRFFPQTRSFQLQCLWSLESLDPIVELKELNELSLGSVLSGDLTLAPIAALGKLRSLRVTGKWRDFFSIGKAVSLERLILSGILEGDLAFLAELPNLKELEIVDSMLRDFSSFSSEVVRSLRLVNLRQMTDLEWLTRFPKLKELKLKSLPKVDRLPPHSFLDRLDSFSATHLRTAGIKNTVELRRKVEELFV